MNSPNWSSRSKTAIERGTRLESPAHESPPPDVAPVPASGGGGGGGGGERPDNHSSIAHIGPCPGKLATGLCLLVGSGIGTENNRQERAMNRLFEELDYQVTPLGTLVLRAPAGLAEGGDIYEIKLNDDFLMSSKFTASEEALARLALEELDMPGLKIVVGGLGLGYTAATALESPNVRLDAGPSDAMQPIIEWHEQGLLPLGKLLSPDPRCRFVLGDFFAMALSAETGFDPDEPASRFHAIMLDIDHSPAHVLLPSNAALYTQRRVDFAEPASPAGRHLCPMVERPGRRRVRVAAGGGLRRRGRRARHLPQPASEPGRASDRLPRAPCWPWLRSRHPSGPVMAHKDVAVEPPGGITRAYRVWRVDG